MERFSTYFSNYIDGDTLGYIGNGEINALSVSRKSRSVNIGVLFDRFISSGIIEKAEKQIASAMELNKVTISPSFPKSEFSISSIENILEYVKHDYPMANGFFDGAEAEIEDNVLTVFLKKGGKEVLESQKIDTAIAKVLYNMFKVDFDISLLEVQAFDIEKAVKEAVAEKHKEQEKERKKKEELKKNILNK